MCGVKLARGFLTRMFNRQCGYSFFLKSAYWFGLPVMKVPLDLWVYQEIIWETRPQVIIETGSCYGGSAQFFASICDLIGEGKVITIDVKDLASRNLSHPRITTIVGDSVSDDVISQVRQIVGNQTAMVSLDSDHSKGHVLREMEVYSEFVSLGNYLVVEDTAMRGRWWFIQRLYLSLSGPGKAVKEFLCHRKDYVRDRTREKFPITTSYGGFLKRISN